MMDWLQTQWAREHGLFIPSEMLLKIKGFVNADRVRRVMRGKASRLLGPLSAYQRHKVYELCEGVEGVSLSRVKETKAIQFSCKDWALYCSMRKIVANRDYLCQSDRWYADQGVYECGCDDMPRRISKYREGNNYDDTQAYYILYHTDVYLKLSVIDEM